MKRKWKQKAEIRKWSSQIVALRATFCACTNWFDDHHSQKDMIGPARISHFLQRIWQKVLCNTVPQL